MTPQLLAQGWSHQKVWKRHVSYAVDLGARGVTWRGLEDSDEPAVEDLVRTHIDGIDPGWTIDDDSGGVVAIGPDQAIIAVLIAAGMKVHGRLIGFIRHLVVANDWRGLGVGAVTLGVAHQVFPVDQEPFMYIGGCAARSARFYQRVGYTVLQPGEPLLLPGAASALAPSNVHYPCWMYREW